jgi:surface antigen
MSVQTSYAQEVKYPSFTIPYTLINKDGERFSHGMGQCVDFVKLSRNLLVGIPVGTAANMPNVAKEKGFEINPLPRVGAVLVVPVHTGVPFGHVAIVIGVKKTGDRSYTLTIVDANSKWDVYSSIPRRDGTFIFKNRAGETVPGSRVIQRDITYTITNNIGEIKDTAFGTRTLRNIVFIHEEKKIYDAKQERASKYINQIYKDLLGREPSDSEKKEYTEKLMSGVITAQQVDATIRSSKEYEQRVAKLREVVAPPPLPVVELRPPPFAVIPPFPPREWQLLSPPRIAPPPPPPPALRPAPGKIMLAGPDRAMGTAAFIPDALSISSFFPTIPEGGHYRLDISGSYNRRGVLPGENPTLRSRDSVFYFRHSGILGGLDHFTVSAGDISFATLLTPVLCIQIDSGEV